MVVSLLLSLGDRVLPLPLRLEAELHVLADRPHPDRGQPGRPAPWRAPASPTSWATAAPRSPSSSSQRHGAPRSRSGRPASAPAAQPGFEPSSTRPASAHRLPAEGRLPARRSRARSRATIERIDGVSSAQVQLVLPNDTLFADQASKATRRGAPDHERRRLDPAAVAGIAHLVASSVQGLSAQNVTITDETGALLWPRRRRGRRRGSGRRPRSSPSSRATTRSSPPRSMRSSRARSAPARPRPGSTPTSTSTRSRSTRSPTTARKVPLNTQTTKENAAVGQRRHGRRRRSRREHPARLRGGQRQQGPRHRLPEHQPATRPTASTRPSSHTVVAPGAVNQLDVALMVDSSVPAKAQTALQQTVATMVGLVPKRGDTISKSPACPSRSRPQRAARPPARWERSASANPLALAQRRDHRPRAPSSSSS